MTDQRRYREEEVRQIFEAAATTPERRPDRAALPATDGLTLAELQEIGREVGLEPARIAEAASSLEQRARALPRRTRLGMPISTGRIVELPRAPSDREWGLLLAELRQTFHASGEDRSGPGVRGWTNGNLHAFIEPSESGHRLRMGTLKGDATAITLASVAGLVMALIMFLSMVVTGDLYDVLGPILIGAMGAGGLAYNALRLPTWAREREEQMDYIAERARAIIGPAPKPDDRLE